MTKVRLKREAGLSLASGLLEGPAQLSPVSKLWCLSWLLEGWSSKYIQVPPWPSLQETTLSSSGAHFPLLPTTGQHVCMERGQAPSGDQNMPALVPRG